MRRRSIRCLGPEGRKAVPQADAWKLPPIAFVLRQIACPLSRGSDSEPLRCSVLAMPAWTCLPSSRYSRALELRLPPGNRSSGIPSFGTPAGQSPGELDSLARPAPASLKRFGNFPLGQSSAFPVWPVWPLKSSRRKHVSRFRARRKGPPRGRTAPGSASRRAMQTPFHAVPANHFCA